MTRSRKVKLMVRWSIFSAVLIAAFWTIWYLVAGQVPAVESIKMTETWTIQLPFAMSRWWDILIGPIWSIIIILVVTIGRFQSEGASSALAVTILGITIGAGLRLIWPTFRKWIFVEE